MLLRRSWKSPALLALGSLAAFAACVDSGSPPPDNNPDPDPDPVGDQVEISGAITEDTTLSGLIHLTGEASIAPGVTVTVDAGTDIKGAQDATVRVEGTLRVEGTADAPVTMYPLGDAPTWAGITVESGGALEIAYARGENVATLAYCKEGAIQCKLDAVEFTDLGYAMITHTTSSIDKSTLIGLANGGITTKAGSDLTITDSYIFTSDGDLIVTQAGSRLTVDYSEIGGAQGSYEHCNLHVGAADFLQITNSNLIEGVYAMMLGGTTDAVIQYNNFMDNDTDILEVGANTNVDMRYNYWTNGAPDLGADYDTSSPAQSAYEQAGPRI